MNHSIEIDYGNFNSINIDKYLSQIPELLSEGYRIRRLSYLLVSDEELLEVNQKHLQHDFYTDIITFDYSKGFALDGEIFISIDRVKENSKNDFLKELLRVVCHGVLHMMGFNDKSDAEIKLMREMEDMWIDKMLVSRET